MTSTGPFVITCQSLIVFSRRVTLTSPRSIGNFKSVKRGKFDDYSIRKYQSNVVADDFKFGTDKNVVVALEQDVFMVNKKHLQKVRAHHALVGSIIADLIFAAHTRILVNTRQTATFPIQHRQFAVLGPRFGALFPLLLYPT